MAVTSVPIPNSLFPNSRSLHPSLLFQFWLAQFLHSYAATQVIEGLYNATSLGETTPKPIVIEREKLLEAIKELSGQVTSYAPTFPWTVHQGSVKALVHYSHLLYKKQPRASIIERSERAYRQARLAKIHLIAWKEEETISQLHLKALGRAIQSLIRNMHRIGQHLLKEIPTYAHDENVIFFLLRHREEFDTLFVAPIVKELLDKMYRGGSAQAEQHLIRQYSKRGFENLLPQVTQAFAHVRANTY